MTESPLSRALRSVGMAFFVRHIVILMDFVVGDQALAAKLRKVEPYTDKSLASRISTARRVVQAGKVEAAIRKIAGAKVDEDIAAQAGR